MDTITVHVTDREGVEHTFEGIVGWQLMEVINDHGLKLPAECGGACACATCHVYVAPEWVAKLPEKFPDEEMMLDDALSPKENSRLSCQIILSAALNGLRVTIAPNP